MRDTKGKGNFGAAAETDTYYGTWESKADWNSYYGGDW